MTRVAFVSFRLKAQDGISVEAEKWIRVFEEWGCDVNRVAGYIPESAEGDYLVPELNDRDPLIESFTARVFSGEADRHVLQSDLAQLSEIMERELVPVLHEIAPDIVVAANVFSLPVNIPFTMVLCRFLADENVACISVNHDFFWERQRFSNCEMSELLASHFPPPLPQMRNVTISALAREELYRRTGIAAACIRNCFDFDAPRFVDDFNADLRRDLGIGEDEVMFLQPTRALERKGIGRAIEFVAEFSELSGRPSRLVITGEADDGFQDTLNRLSSNPKANVMHLPGWLGRRRDCPDARSRYDLADAYAQCDMVTFPSTWETFGNPVLEAVAHRKLVIVAGYPVLEELRAFGFQFLSMDRHAARRAVKLMEYQALMEEMTARNFETGRKHFSLENLKADLAELVSSVIIQ